jgi:hypothetical protein
MRRHPRWRKEVNAPATRPTRATGLTGARGLVVIGFLLLAAAFLARLLGA